MVLFPCASAASYENWVKCPLRREEKTNTIPGVEKLGISEEVFTTIALLLKMCLPEQLCKWRSVYHNNRVSEEVFKATRDVFDTRDVLQWKCLPQELCCGGCVYHKGCLTGEAFTVLQELCNRRRVYHNNWVTQEVFTTHWWMRYRKFPAEGSCFQEQNVALEFKKLEDCCTNATA